MTIDTKPSASSSTSRSFATNLSQERIVLGIAIFLFVVFGITLPGFLDPQNIISLIQSVSILGILGIGMAITIIGRNIDLTVISVMAMSTAWVLYMIGNGTPVLTALLLGYLFVVAVGIIIGLLVAYAEIPAIFATLAMITAVYGFSRVALVDLDLAFLPESASWMRGFGGGYVLGIPVPVLAFAGVALIVHLFLKYTKLGTFVRMGGDNPLRARIAGVPTRPMIVFQYVLSASIAFFAGLLLATLVATMNTRIVNSTMVYDVILVVVLGGVVLSGGRGGVTNVIVGTILIGILLNGMTIMNVSYSIQNLIKGVMLLTAIVVDTYLNPRDEQTSQQGDI
ncbi:ABC transporter permease [Mesorhizobium sp. ASY16-5R]|jgi:ribose transport system permease protein|uniref:ABC transporter permease n=1 Tax=Mesorhizobium sp. ASY16-5R TaxID=3445772 RepID=UPI003FA0300F